ncbi:hypothetical protein E3N88_25560 [Mikania micrantha]|uniref:DUF8040 domain-containing protein n=1 Tax=Mikania micrantha TaxID=192012 RepID=A0A5N6N602_9ASTR|nr:hypothetical protein E3N88_25560 [Mikania micrantha]
MRDNDSSMTGHKYTLELLQGGPKQCHELLRMSLESFVRLCAHFRVNYSLKDSKHVSVEEKMAMFLMIIGHNQRYVVVKRRFQHSKQTIHKFFYEVLDKMMLFAKDMIVPTSFNPNPNIPGNGHARHVHVDDDEDKVEAHGTASDREYMIRLRDEIAYQLMQIRNE